MAKTIMQARPKRPKRRPPSKISVAISCMNCVLLLCVMALSLPLSVPKAFGYQPYTVVSGSMEPAIPVGALVYVKNEAPDGFRADDVAAFYKGGDPGTIIIHRVVENDTVSGLLTTKGDANAEPDFEPAKYSECVGRVAKSFPGLGGLADMMTSGPGKTAVLCAIGLAAVTQAAAGYIDKKQGKKDPGQAPGKEAKA